MKKVQNDEYAPACIAEAETNGATIRVLRAREVDERDEATAYKTLVFRKSSSTTYVPDPESTEWESFDEAMSDFAQAIRYEEIEGGE